MLPNFRALHYKNGITVFHSRVYNSVDERGQRALIQLGVLIYFVAY